MQGDRPVTTVHAPGAVRILLVALGTRGDVQPLCVLGRALRAKGYRVLIVTTPDYGALGRRYGLDVREVGPRFSTLLDDPTIARLLRGDFAAKPSSLLAIGVLGRLLGEHLEPLLEGCLAEIGKADLVVFNPIAFFAGELARERGLPSIRVTCQPLLPSWRMPLCLLGTGDLGWPLNRLSYELFRLLPFLLRRALRSFQRRSGAARQISTFSNPLTFGNRISHQLLAFSATLAPNPGDWQRVVEQTGFWFDEPAEGEALPDAVTEFIGQGPPPVYLGIGSMRWGRSRYAEVVDQALALWGGRAIVAGDARPEKEAIEAAPNVLTIVGLNHLLLFPHLAGAVHHGGAGTTAAALRCGLPSIVLPVLGDQLYWGRRVAALGAALDPIPLGRITPETLARCLETVVADGRYRDAARRIETVVSREPGVAAAIAAVDRLADAPKAEPRL